jgi:hypothetical protein
MLMLPLVGSWSSSGSDLIVTISVIGLAIFGWRQGLFVITLVGLQMLVSFVAALVVGSVAVSTLQSMEGAAPGRLLGIVYLVGFAAFLIGIRLAIGRFVPEMAVPLPWPIDRGLGALVGSLAGWLLAGAILVAWSLAMLPGSLRFSSGSLQRDPGTWVLDTFARCVEADLGRCREFLAGNAGRGPWPDSPRCSEPIIDSDGNGRYDEGEPFLDVDGDGAFTRSLGFHDTHGDHRRRLGLAECYRFGAWEGITVWHAPEITSEDRVRLGVLPTADEPLYQAVARDVDGTAGLAYSLRPEVDEDRSADDAAAAPSPPLAIDPGTGIVSFPTGPGDTQRRVSFTVVVTDPAGLTDERMVLVTW